MYHVNVYTLEKHTKIHYFITFFSHLNSTAPPPPPGLLIFKLVAQKNTNNITFLNFKKYILSDYAHENENKTKYNTYFVLKRIHFPVTTSGQTTARMLSIMTISSPRG